MITKQIYPTQLSSPHTRFLIQALYSLFRASLDLLQALYMRDRHFARFVIQMVPLHLAPRLLILELVELRLYKLVGGTHRRSLVSSVSKNSPDTRLRLMT